MAKNADLSFRLPETGDEEMLREYAQEHHSFGEAELSAGMELGRGPYDEWVRQMQKNALQGSGQWGRSYELLCFEGTRLIGLLNIRLELGEEARQKNGDIGYGVRPSARKKGYATAMLRYALDVCRKEKMSRVILGCYRDNAGSAKVIQNNGGILLREEDTYTKGRMSRYYEIKL